MVLFTLPAPSGFSRLRRDLGALLGSQLSRPGSTTFEPTQATQCDSVWVLGRIGHGYRRLLPRIVLRDLAGCLLDYAIRKLVRIAGTGFA